MTLFEIVFPLVVVTIVGYVFVDFLIDEDE